MPVKKTPASRMTWFARWFFSQVDFFRSQGEVVIVVGLEPLSTMTRPFLAGAR
jgi:hypothetical protein